MGRETKFFKGSGQLGSSQAGLPLVPRVGHQQTEDTIIRCNQWLSPVKTTLKVPPADRNRSLVANTNMCG